MSSQIFSIEVGPVSTLVKESVQKGLSSHAIASIGSQEIDEPIAFTALSDQGNLLGAVIVQAFFGALHIKNAFVDDLCRGQGIGKALMEQALDYGRKQGLYFAFVETLSFQALDFYKKLGFELEFTRTGYRHNTAFHYLKKQL